MSLTQRRKGRKGKRALATFASWRELWLLLLVLVFAAGPLFAQCAMCYQNAAAQGTQAMHALNLGIVILLLPPAAIAACIARAAYRYRDSSPPIRPTTGGPFRG